MYKRESNIWTSRFLSDQGMKYIARNECSKSLNSIKSRLENLTHTNVSMLHIPQRYYLTIDSVVNTEVQKASQATGKSPRDLDM
jgi:hypothetical protein